jgi:hypothetical protein
MNPRHAATLALVGWYLMMPVCYGSRDTLTLREDLPLSKWTVWQSFDSADGCETVLRETRKKYKHFIRGPESDDQKRGVLSGLAQYIASDDPRLAK